MNGDVDARRRLSCGMRARCWIDQVWLCSVVSGWSGSGMTAGSWIAGVRSGGSFRSGSRRASIKKHRRSDGSGLCSRPSGVSTVTVSWKTPSVLRMAQPSGGSNSVRP